MTKPTYEELEIEVRRLRARLSFGEDKEFTRDVLAAMPSRKQLESFESRGVFVVRPAELWSLLFPDCTNPSTDELAKLGRSLQALGWTRSAKRGNLVFKLPVEEHPQ